RNRDGEAQHSWRHEDDTAAAGVGYDHLSRDPTYYNTPGILTPAHYMHPPHNSVRPMSKRRTPVQFPLRRRSRAVHGRGQPETLSCPTHGVHPYPKNCSLYIKCGWHPPYLEECPPGKLFNPQSNYCDLPDRVDCPSMSPVSAPRTTTLPPVSQLPIPKRCPRGYDEQRFSAVSDYNDVTYSDK
ncbi:hypothetical protein OTU49_002133, partial [Cherax quadricarinatus]